MTVPRKVHGADISHHQRVVNLKQAKDAGLKFLYHKCTEGDSVRDDLYASRRDQAKDAGLPFGAYHFARPGHSDAIAEARFFLQHAKPRRGDLVPALDLETNDGNLSDAALLEWAKTFIREVLKQTGAKKGVLYSPFFSNVAHDFIRWVPRYNKSNTPPAGLWDIWQFSNGVLGEPNTFPGLGHVDLNTMQANIKVTDFTIPKVSDPVRDPIRTRKSVKFKITHLSLQFNDTIAHRKADIQKVFADADETGQWAITGTESLEADTRLALTVNAAKYGFALYMGAGTDAWVAVRKSRIDGEMIGFTGPVVVPGKAGVHAAKKVVCAQFHNKDIGTVAIYAAHAPAEKDFENQKKLMDAIGAHALDFAKGRNLAFLGLDGNRQDMTFDMTYGNGFLSCWDELGEYPSTGHGTIDAVCRWLRDTRVKLKSAVSLPDENFALHGDHYLVKVVYDIEKVS